MASLTNALVQLRSRVGIQATDQIAQDTDLTFILNEALNALASEQDWWWLEEVTSFTTTAGIDNEALPADHKTTKWLWSGNTLIHPRQLQDTIHLENDTAEIPAYYTIKDSRIFLAPAPSNSTTTIYHYYVRKENTLSAGGDEPLLPSRYDGLWLSMAAVMLCDRRGDMKGRQIHERARDEWLKRARDEARAHRGLPPVRTRKDAW